MSLPVDRENTTVIDLTYVCNATCRYCQWGSKLTQGRVHRPIEEILLTREALRALGTERIVLSGGEPRLHPRINEILTYYRDLVDDVIVITNGYGLDTREASKIVAAGATGITVSLDSLFPDLALITRNTPATVHRQLITNLQNIAEGPREFELGLNSVVSHPTANWPNVKGLLDFGSRLRFDFVKFQPIFDDGYVGRNSPDLKLTFSDVPSLTEISEELILTSHPLTNPKQFWKDLAALVSGKELAATACGLGPRHSILTRDKLNVCFWLDSASFGGPNVPLTREGAQMVRDTFEKKKLTCRVGAHCFCTQNIEHEWNDPLA